MYFSIADLTAKFNALDEEHRKQVFAEIESKIDIYHKLAPNLPLLRYVKHGEDRVNGVPAEQHGPIITEYKNWKANQ